ncbi:MAG: fumarylacetoacetate hydrolase family protein [Bacteroidetes bacterium]|nr:MAG: fumarylacetoacetate hydrolase family protein [Bacteroidota bacterium]
MKHATFTDGSSPIPLNTLFCVGQNYAEHAKEMGSTVADTPVIFFKPVNAVVTDGAPVIIPAITTSLHHEVELTVLIGTGGRDIPRSSALSHVAGYGVGLDMTMRDVQSAAKKAGMPWATAKGFHTSAPLSPFVPAARVPDPQALEISLAVNGALRQRTSTATMNFSVAVLIEYLSSVFSLESGDVIYTGTPEGVAAVTAGDELAAELHGLVSITHRIVAR